MYRTALVELTLVCRRCGGAQALSTLADPATCAQCGEANPLPWKSLLEVEVRGLALSLSDVLPGLADGRVVTGASSALRVRVEVGAARCPCGAELTLEAIQRVNRLRPAVICGACGASTAARRPPDPLLEAYPAVMYVIGEGDTVASDGRAGVVIKCGECGARLDGDVCPHCGASNVRPARVGAVSAGHGLAFVLRTER